MGIVSQHQITAFVNPANGQTPIDATVVRGNDNTIRTNYNAHDVDTTIHLQNGIVSTRPAASIAGQMWLASDASAVYQYLDTGSAWVEINYLRNTGGTITGNITVNGTSALNGDVTVQTGATTYTRVNGSTSAILHMRNSGAGADLKNWQAVVTGTTFLFRTFDDAESVAHTWLTVQRGAATAVTSITFADPVVSSGLLTASAGLTVSAGTTSLQITTAKRYLGSNGTAHVAGDYALSGSWGGGSVSVVAKDTGGRVSITAAGVPTVNPTIALTFKDGTWTNAPSVSYSRGEFLAPTTAVWSLTTITATVATWTFSGVPTAGFVYILDFVTMGT